MKQNYTTGSSPLRTAASHRRAMGRLLLMTLLLFAFVGGAKAQDYFYEGFEGGAMPEGWTTDGPGTWSVGTGDYNASTGAGAGTYNAKITHGSTGNVTKLITPAIDLSAATAAQLSFMHIQRSWAGDIDKLKVCYRTSSEGEWVQLAEYTDAYASWTLEGDNGEITLPNLSSTYQIAFEMTDAYGYGVGIDEVTIFEVPSCSKPTAFAVSEIGSHSAVLSWTPGSVDQDAWQICINGNEENLIDVTENPYTLTGLTPETAYTVKVRGNCGEEKSRWSANVSFTTLELYARPTALAISEVGSSTAVLSWTENGEATIWEICLNDDEESIITANNNSYTLTGLTPETAYTAKVRAYLGPDAKSHWSANVSFTTLELYARPTGLAASEVSSSTAVLSWTENGEATAWEICLNNDEENLIPANNNSYTLTGLTPETAYTAKVRACYNADAKSNWSFNISFTTLEQYAKPTGLAVSEVGPKTAVLGWTENGEATAWEICLNDDEENLITADSNPFTLTGLTPETAYTAKVRACYDADAKSNWSSKVNFLTLVACAKPTNLSVTNVTHNSATISWTGSGDAYDLRYAVMPESRGNAYLQYSTEDFVGGVGTAGGAVYWGIRFPAADLAAYDGQTLTQVGIFTDSDGDYGWTYSGNYTVRVYQGGDTAPGTLVSEATEYLPGDFAWHDITLTTPVEIDATQDLWLTFYTPDIAYPMSGCTYVGNLDSDFLSLDGNSWEHSTDYGLDYTWMIRGFVELSESDWVDIFDLNTNSCQIASLTPNTTYIVKVRSSYDEDGKSNWVTTAFTTEELVELVNDDSGNEDGKKNSDFIANAANKLCDVTLSGRTLYKDGMWNTLCLPFDVTLAGSPLEGATARTLTAADVTGSGDDTRISLTFGDPVEQLAAGVPYIIKWANDGSDNIENPEFTGVTIGSTEGQTLSFLEGQVQFKGNYSAFTAGDNNIYYMSTGDETHEGILRKAASTRTMLACRAYFQFADAEAARSIILNFGEGETMGIVEQRSENTTADGSWYTVDGVKLDKQPARKGLYIQGGRKVVVK